jgi:hypothetical protein
MLALVHASSSPSNLLPTLSPALELRTMHTYSKLKRQMYAYIHVRPCNGENALRQALIRALGCFRSCFASQCSRDEHVCVSVHMLFTILV